MEKHVKGSIATLSWKGQQCLSICNVIFNLFQVVELHNFGIFICSSVIFRFSLIPFSQIGMQAVVT